jgi:pyrroline-5-carboxylate reductase
MKIGIIGFGNMGSAIAGKLKIEYKIYCFDKDKAKISNITNISVADSNVDLISRVDAIILAVKPQDFDSVLDEIKESVKDKLIISIAAGITTGYIEKRLGQIRVVRAMPNMAIKIGRGITCLCKGRFLNEEDLNFSQEIFKNLGKILILKEDMMDAATAISGSGPGYYFDIVESDPQSYKDKHDEFLNNFIASLTEAAEYIGFKHAEAVFLANTTGLASDLLLIETGLSARELKKQVASKGGTTQAGLEVLHKGGTLKEAAKAALIRARELSKKE